MPGADGLDDTCAFECLKTSLQSNDWVVYSKAPFAGATNVVAYLGRYTHKSAISNHRLVDFDGEQVRFRWRDYAHANKRKVMRLDDRRVHPTLPPARAPAPLHPRCATTACSPIEGALASSPCAERCCDSPTPNRASRKRPRR